MSVFLLSSCLKVPREKDIYGIWGGKDKGAEVTFNFDENETCEITFRDITDDSVGKRELMRRLIQQGM